MLNLNNILGQYTNLLLLCGLLLALVGNLWFWLGSKKQKNDSQLSDILLRGQAELAGRLSQLGEYNAQ